MGIFLKKANNTLKPANAQHCLMNNETKSKQFVEESTAINGDQRMVNIA
jgi:hypothetical protein